MVFGLPHCGDGCKMAEGRKAAYGAVASFAQNGAGGRMRAGRRVQTGETRWANGSTARPVSPRQAGEARSAVLALLNEAPESVGFAPRKGVEPTEEAAGRLRPRIHLNGRMGPTGSLRPMWQLTVSRVGFHDRAVRAR